MNGKPKLLSAANITFLPLGNAHSNKAHHFKTDITYMYSYLIHYLFFNRFPLTFVFTMIAHTSPQQRVKDLLPVEALKSTIFL